MSDLPLRGLEEGFAGTPLRRFTGIFKGHEEEPARGYEGTRTTLNFADVEVLESTEPYNFPTAQLNFGVSNRKESRWGYLAQSLVELIPEDEDIDDQIDKRWGLVYADGQDGRPEPKPIWSRNADKDQYPDGRIPTPVWVVYELEGKVAGEAAKGGEGNTALERAMSLLDGKTLSEFNKVALADVVIRKDKSLPQAIVDKSFVKSMIEGGLFTKDENDIYHRVTD